MAIVRTLPTDDDGSGLTGTVFDRAWWLNKYNEIDNAISQAITHVLPVSGTVARLDLGSDPAREHVCTFGGAADLTIQTISAARRGDRVRLIHGGTAGHILLPHAFAAECLQNFITGIPTVIGAGGHATYEYLGPYWHLMDHAQVTPRAYVPVWGGGNPQIGNGILTGRYVMDGNQIAAQVTMQLGSSSTTGAGGQYTWSLPCAAAFDNETSIGAVLDSGSGYFAIALATVGSTVAGTPASGQGLPVSASMPMVWAVNDRLDFSHRYTAK